MVDPKTLKRTFLLNLPTSTLTFAPLSTYVINSFFNPFYVIDENDGLVLLLEMYFQFKNVYIPIIHGQSKNRRIATAPGKHSIRWLRDSLNAKEKVTIINKSILIDRPLKILKSDDTTNGR